MKIYGIKNCDTVRKAIKYLDAHNVAYEFVDVKITELSAELIGDWLQRYPEHIVNKRSTTYRAIKSDWLNAAIAEEQIALIQKNPTVIKRPVLVLDDGRVIIGFDKDMYQSLSD